MQTGCYKGQSTLQPQDAKSSNMITLTTVMLAGAMSARLGKAQPSRAGQQQGCERPTPAGDGPPWDSTVGGTSGLSKCNRDQKCPRRTVTSTSVCELSAQGFRPPGLGVICYSGLLWEGAADSIPIPGVQLPEGWGSTGLVHSSYFTRVSGANKILFSQQSR